MLFRQRRGMHDIILIPSVQLTKTYGFDTLSFDAFIGVISVSTRFGIHIITIKYTVFDP